MTHVPGRPMDTGLFRVARHDFSGGGKTVTTTSNSAPWSGQQGPLLDIFKQAQALGDQPQSYYSGNTVVPLSSQTEQGLQAQEQRALTGSPLLKQTQANAMDSLSGNLNPALTRMIGQVQEQLRPGIDAQFAGNGRYGSGAHANAMASALTNAGTQLAYNDYNSAMSAAPELAMQDYADPQMLRDVGGIREQQSGAQIQDALARYNFAQNEPWNRLQKEAALVGGGSFGQSSSGTQPIYSSPLATGAGLGFGTIGALGSLFGKGGIWPSGDGFMKMFGGP